MDIKDYNKTMSERWCEEANKLNSQLLFALSVDEKGAVNFFWDNARGNPQIAGVLKEIVMMLEKKESVNFSSKNQNHKFTSLVGKRVNIFDKDKIVNSYKFERILETTESMEGRGKLFECHVDFKDKSAGGAYPVMDFDEQTLNELLESGVSICPVPYMKHIRYEIEKLN